MKLSNRGSTLLHRALTLYEKKAESVKKGTEEIQVSTIAVDTALARVAELRRVLASVGTKEHLPLAEAEFDPLRAVAIDALSYLLGQIQKVKEKQEDLFIPTEDTVEAEADVKRLVSRFSGQMDLDEELELEREESRLDHTTVEFRSGDKTTGPMSGREFARRARSITEGATAAP